MTYGETLPHKSTGMNFSEKSTVGGTLLWYYGICHREVWLMARRIVPEERNEDIAIGRIIDHNSYSREKHQISFGDNKIDFLQQKDGMLVVSEIKKSSRAESASVLQIAHYLYELEKAGFKAEGVLLYPKEKKRTDVVLNDTLRRQLDAAYKEIEIITAAETPPPLIKCKFCAKCAYSEYCWS